MRGLGVVASSWARLRQGPRLTLFARCLVIMVLEVLANAFLWILCAILFTRGNDRKILSLALVAWTTGLRHGLDADHISAIDNATRRIVSVPSDTGRRRRPVTVGLFFSLGHSTIVFATTVAIAISASVADHLDGVSSVSGIIGAAVSGSFLFLIGCINSVILYRTWMRLLAARRREAEKEKEEPRGEEAAAASDKAEEGINREKQRFNGCMTRLALPLLKAVDRPWKMFPVGVLFGLGFDTASSIALLGVAALAFQRSNNENGGGGSDGDSRVILLALLFTAGMTMVDSADSCLMIWAYAPEQTGSGRKKFALLLRDEERQTGVEEGQETVEKRHEENDATPDDAEGARAASQEHTGMEKKECWNERQAEGEMEEEVQRKGGDSRRGEEREKIAERLDAPASRFSLLLTLLSILVAFAISIIVLLGLIGDECARCARAADKQEQTGDGDLEGRWWLAWRRANDNSGYVGAGIVGAFALCVAVYFVTSMLLLRKKLGRS